MSIWVCAIIFGIACICYMVVAPNWPATLDSVNRDYWKNKRRK